LASSFKKINIENIEKLDKNLLDSIKRNSIINLTENVEENNINLVDISLHLETEKDSGVLDTSEYRDKEINILDNFKYLYEAPSKEIKKPVYLTFKEIFKLAQLIHESLFNSYPNLKNIFDYFNSISKAFSALDIPISWSPPSGANIKQKYLKFKKVKVSISVGKGRKKTVVLSQKLNEMDSKAQILALNPNFIHSLDSSLVILLLSKHKKELNPLITIHDCFISHPNRMLKLVEILQEEFINLFEKENLLYRQENFHQDLLPI